MATLDDVMEEIKEIRRLLEEMRGGSGGPVITIPSGTYFRAPAERLRAAGLADRHAAAALEGAEEVLWIPLPRRRGG